MFLKPHQMYLESQGLYQKICRLAQVRTEIKKLNIEEDQLVQAIYDAMCPATEIVDLTFLRMQKGVSEQQLAEMYVARWQSCDRSMAVHPAYVSDRFRPDGNAAEEEEEAPEKDDEREASLSPAPLSLQEKEEERDDDVRDAIDVQGFISFFNQVMDDHQAKIPRIVSLSGNRLRALKARCREHSKEEVIHVIHIAAAEPFLNGGGDKGWIASLDWLLKPNNFCKVLEGAYIQFHKKVNGLSPERLALIHEIERQQHEELHRRLDEQSRGAVTYEEYVRMRDAGELSTLNS